MNSEGDNPGIRAVRTDGNSSGRERRGGLARLCDPRCAWAALLGSLLYFFAVGAYSLREPGLQYDEAFDAVVALDVLAGRSPQCESSTRLLGLDLPLMIHPHIGATSTYTSLAGFLLLGPSVESLRLSQLTVGALALVLLFLLARTWFDGRVAAIATMLCGSAPAFIWWSRGGANWTVPLLPASLGTLLALTSWWRHRQPLALATAAFAFGVGLTTKILFVWLLLPMSITAILALGPRAVWTALRQTGGRALVLAAAALALGLAPLIADNIPEAHLFEHVALNTTANRWGHDNHAFLHNVVQAVSSYLGMMDGEVLMATPRFGYVVGSVAFVLAVLHGLTTLLHDRRPTSEVSRGDGTRRRNAFAARTFLVAVPLTVLPQSAITTSVVSSTYTFLIVPLVWLLIAQMLVDRSAPDAGTGRLAGATPVVRAGALALLLLLLANHVSTNAALSSFFARTGGRRQWSDAIYRTADVLERAHPSGRIVALDWGFARSLELLTALRLHIEEGHEFSPAPSPSYPEQARKFLVPGTILLAHVEGVAICSACLRTVKDIAIGLGLDLVLRHEVRDGEGLPHTEIYEVVAGRSQRQTNVGDGRSTHVEPRSDPASV